MTPKIVLITGATRGIGRHAALALARRGHRVIATGRRREALDALVAEHPDLPLDAVLLDVNDAGSIAAAAAAVDDLTAGAGVDVLINNAGYGQLGAVLDVADDQVRRQFETNVFGLLAVTRAFAPAMIRRGHGRIVNVSSLGGRFTIPLFGVYNATKYAVESLSDALRAELRPYGVHVSVVEPGFINTNFAETATASVVQGGAWAPVYAAAERSMSIQERFAPDPAPISRVLTHAVEARRPRVRYVAPWRDGVMVGILRALPSRLVDAIGGWFLGLGAARVDLIAAPAAEASP